MILKNKIIPREFTTIIGIAMIWTRLTAAENGLAIRRMKIIWKHSATAVMKNKDNFISYITTLRRIYRWKKHYWSDLVVLQFYFLVCMLVWRFILMATTFQIHTLEPSHLLGKHLKMWFPKRNPLQTIIY